MARLSLLVGLGLRSIVAATPKYVPTEPMSLSHPGVLEQQPSEEGKDDRFSKILKQGCATQGPRA